MSLEIEQPSHLARPDLTDPIVWASLAPLHCEWLRAVAPQLGLDTPLVIRGDALSSIIGDDENSFGVRAAYLPELTDLARQMISIRMQWEIELPELPMNIRNQLRTVLAKLTTVNWDGKDNFTKAREMWVKEAKHFTKHQIALHKPLRDALQYEYEAKRCGNHIGKIFYMVIGYLENNPCPSFQIPNLTTNDMSEPNSLESETRSSFPSLRFENRSSSHPSLASRDYRTSCVRSLDSLNLLNELFYPGVIECTV